jgi:molybdopterin-guanine dinucleotide biosynthesis protein A
VSGESAGRLTALVLAGERPGGDPLARAAGVPHKALIEVGGVPMLVRVVGCLSASGRVERVVVSSASPGLLDAHPELRRLHAAGLLGHRRSGASPAASVVDALADLPPEAPLLVTTADHPLLLPAMIEYFCTQAERSGADVAAAVVSEPVLRARFPDSRRTFIPLRGEAVTGANLFWLRGSAGAAAASFWRRTEAVRKRPWRLAGLFGFRALLGFALRRLDLDAAARLVSARMGVRAAVVRMPFAECGIDVDRPEDVVVVDRELRARASSPV